MELAPDLLDLWGLSIREVGSVQVGVESTRLYWPGGELRVCLLVQAAWSGACEVTLELSGAGPLAARTFRVPHAEVRRIRLAAELPGGVEPVSLGVRAPVRQGTQRVRAAWIKGATESEAPRPSWGGTVLGALRQAVGKRERREEQVAPETAVLPLELCAVAGEPPIAAEEDAIWQPGMAVPPVQPVRLDHIGAAPNLASRADASGDRPECPHCFTRAYLEQVREERRCPGCGHAWAL